jgi:hypothetical protein
MKKKTKIKADIEQECIAIVNRERVMWEDAVCYVTEKVGFKMREMVRTFRKNYWGVFDEPIDPITGREKVWIPLGMSIVDDVTKNIDIDQKDVDFIARTPKGYALTDLTRASVKEYLGKMYFGQTLDEDERQCVIDGTVVWKTWEDKSTGKPIMKRRTVDLLHVYIDPTEQDIQSAYRFTERGLQLPSQIEAMTGWVNTDDIEGVEGLDKNDSRRGARSFNRGTGKFVDVWETWGKIPKWLVTGDKKADDAMEEIDGHIIVSGLEAQGPRLHLVEENTRKDKFGNSLKPYEEWRPCKIAGRWYGLGYMERILALQEWLNTTDNIRINRSYVSQLGLFKIKKGKGITPQMLSRLPVNGAILVNDMDDIEQFQTSEVGATSYKDEEVIKEWAVKVTSAYPISAGDTMPASTSATASAIANTNSKSSYTLFKEATGHFLERWIDRHALPIIAKTIKVGDVVRLSSSDEQYKAIVERVVAIALEKEMEDLYSQGLIPTEQQVQDAIQMQESKLRKQPQIFIEMVDNLIAEEVDTKVKITNEDLDTSVTVQNLLTMLQLAPEYKDSIVKQVYDLLGLEQPQTPRQQAPQQMPAQNIAPMNLQQITQRAQQPQM